MSNEINEKNLVGYLIEYEEGGMEYDKGIELFQFLVDTGIAWRLQGSYGRYAKQLIESGLIKEKGAKNVKQE